MLDAETEDYVRASRDRRQIEISARFRTGLNGTGPAAVEAEVLAWARLRELVLEAVGRYEGLRLMREKRDRRQLVFTGPAGAWKAFLAENRALTAETELEVRRYEYDWLENLSLSPWHK